jgi:Haemolysin-III related
VPKSSNAYRTGGPGIFLPLGFVEVQEAGSTIAKDHPRSRSHGCTARHGLEVPIQTRAFLRDELTVSTIGTRNVRASSFHKRCHRRLFRKCPSPAPCPSCRPFSEPYDRAELVADAMMHVAGLAFAVVGMVLLTSKADGLPRLQSASIWIYGVGLVTTFATSAAYNIWPVSSAKLILRRFDQAAIFLFIAASYTPFIAHAEQTRKFCSDNRGPPQSRGRDLGRGLDWSNPETCVSRSVRAFPSCCVQCWEGVGWRSPMDMMRQG